MSDSPLSNPTGRGIRPILVNRRFLFAAAGLVLLVSLGIAVPVLLAAREMSARVATQSPVVKTEPTPVPTAEPKQRIEPSPSPARLALQTDPTGAAVQVDGRERGITPVVVENLVPGTHRVTLSLPGADQWQDEISLEPDETKRVQITLQRAPEPTATAPAILQGPIYPLAIMVENSVDARPQSGLARADLVYEALVEGGISRFMAVYVNSQSDAIGPVRSARHYFVYLAAEHNASYVHIGASPQGYEALSAVKITRLDETYGDPGFWRISSRYAPHNAYTSTDLLRSSLDRVRKVTPGSMAGFQFREDPKRVQGSEAHKISLTYPGGYQVDYVYSPEENSYLRSMDGYAQRDADTGEQVAPQNVVVQFVKAWLIPGDDAGRLDMEQLGEGKALYFRNGVVTEGYWHKPSYGNVTEWYDADWNPIQFNPGKIWVQIIPPTGKVTY